MADARADTEDDEVLVPRPEHSAAEGGAGLRRQGSSLSSSSSLLPSGPSKLRSALSGGLRSAASSARSFFSELRSDLRDAADGAFGGPGASGSDAGASEEGSGAADEVEPAGRADGGGSAGGTPRSGAGKRAASSSRLSLAPPEATAAESGGGSGAGGADAPATPWAPAMRHEWRFERAFRARALKVAKESWRFAAPADRDDMLKAPDAGDAADAKVLNDPGRMSQAAAALSVDPALQRLRYKLVPRAKTEEVFWAAYFAAVDDVKREVLTAAASAEANAHREVNELARVNWDDDGEATAAHERADRGREASISGGGRARRPAAVPRASAAMSSEGLRALGDALALAKGWRSMEALARSRTGRAPQVAAEAGAPPPQAQRAGAAGGDASAGGSDGSSGRAGASKDLASVGLSFMRSMRNALDRVSSGADALLNDVPKGGTTATASLADDERAALYTLFDTDAPTGDPGERAAPVVPPSLLPYEIAAAPPAGFVSCLAMVFALQREAPAMARFWLACCDEVAWHWEHGVPLPRLPREAAPDTRFCLLNQKLQLLNCCMARRERRRRWREVETASRAAGRCDRVGVARRVGELKETAVLSEDMMRETEELLMKTGSMGAGAQQLQGDIAAFKAANPGGATLADFVRWHSRSDWIVAEGAADCEGELSTRMLEEGNLWQTLWDATPPQPAGEQPPLFDEQHVGDGVIAYLRELAPSEVLETAFLAALGAAHTAASVSKGAAAPPLCEALADARTIAAQTAGRGMSQAKVDKLVSVFQQLEEWMLESLAQDTDAVAAEKGAAAEDLAADSIA